MGADRHREERTRLVDHQARLRTLGKRERELAKHLDFLVTKLTEASATACKEGGAHDGESPMDFHNLPGLCLNKLLGPLHLQEPPAVIKQVLETTQEPPAPQPPPQPEVEKTTVHIPG